MKIKLGDHKKKQLLCHMILSILEASVLACGWSFIIIGLQRVLTVSHEELAYSLRRDIPEFSATESPPLQWHQSGYTRWWARLPSSLQHPSTFPSI